MPADHDPDDADGLDDEDAVFVLGAGRSADLTPDELEHRRRTKRFALWSVAVVVVVVAVSITLVSLLVDTSSPPASPRAAAQQWANALVRGDHAALRRLECADPGSAEVLELIGYALTDAHAGVAGRSARNRWSVPVEFDNAGGGRSGADITVVRRDGRYLVC